MTIFSGGAGLAIQLISTMILARLLSPRDFGLVAMATTFSLLLVNFGLNGLTEAVVQRETINDALASNLFWICTGAGLALTLGFGVSGSLLARFYGEQDVAPIAAGVAVSIFFTSASVLHLGLLKRSMQFSAVAANDIVARFVSVAVSVGLGLAGWGKWALVIGTCALPFSQMVGSWIVCRWVPRRPGIVPGTGEMVRFALHTYGRFGVNYTTQNTDNLLVGWRFGAQSIGFYKKAYDLFTLPAIQLVSSTTVVAVSALSRVKDDREQHARYLLGAMMAMAFLGMGLAGDLTLVGKDLIRVLLGGNWGEAGRIFTIFGPGIGFMLIYSTHGWIHLSIGRADRWFLWGIVEWVTTCSLFLLGLHWGPSGVAGAWGISFLVLTVPAMWYAGKPIGFGVGPVLAAVWRYIAAALLAGVACYYIPFHLVPGAGETTAVSAMIRVVLVSAGFVGLYLGSVALLHGGLLELKKMLNLLLEMVPVLGFVRATEQTVEEEIPELAHAIVAAPPVFHGNRPLVSILIPAYNAEKWIAETIQSAMAQTWEPKEIIVVDDGSRDRTAEVARRFESENVHVITRPNQGASAARNAAFALSRGDFIQWLDADDLLAPDKIARQMEAFENGANPKVLLSSEWGHFMYRQRKTEFNSTALWRDLSPTEWLICKLGQNLYMQTATWLVSRELTELAGPWDTRLLSDDDGEYFCRVLLASDGVRFVPKSRVYYRSPGLAFAGLSYIGHSEKKIIAHWLSMQLHIQYLRSLEESERVKTACLQYLQTSLINFYPERPEIVEQATQIATELGGQLGLPSLSWKYSWIKTVFGWRRAKLSREMLLKLRWTSTKMWDKMLFRMSERGLAENERQ